MEKEKYIGLFRAGIYKEDTDATGFDISFEFSDSVPREVLKENKERLDKALNVLNEILAEAFNCMVEEKIKENNMLN